jgi:hypothetical protein
VGVNGVQDEAFFGLETTDFQNEAAELTVTTEKTGLVTVAGSDAFR